MKADPVPVGLGTAFIVFGLAITYYRKLKEKNVQKKAFLLLVMIWTIVFFLVTIPMSYQLRPRFFVVVFPIPYIFFCLWFVLLRDKFANKASAVIFTIVVSVLLLNVYGTYAWFRENSLSQDHAVETGRTYILKNQDGVTLGQLERAVDFIYQNRDSNKIIFYTKPEYITPITYLLYQKKNNELSYDNVNSPQDLIGHKFVYSLVRVSGGYDSISEEKVSDHASVVSQDQFGQLVVFTMEIDQNNIPPRKEKQKDEQKVVEEKTERLFWRDVFGLSSEEVDIELGKKE